MVGGRKWGWRKKNGGKDTRQHGEDGEREGRCGKKGRYRYRLTMTIDDGSNKVVRDGTAVQLDKQPNSIPLLSRDRSGAFHVSISSPSRQQQGAVDTTSTTNETDTRSMRDRDNDDTMEGVKRDSVVSPASTSTTDYDVSNIELTTTTAETKTITTTTRIDNNCDKGPNRAADNHEEG